MIASPVLLQKKYVRVVTHFAKKAELPFDAALDFFYHSELYLLVSKGISDMHCMSDTYLADELVMEYDKKMKI